MRLTSDLRTKFRPRMALHVWLAITQSKHKMADGRRLENRYDVIFPQRVVRFGRNSADQCRISRRYTVKPSRSKSKVEFQYGGRLLFQTGSSYISAMNCDMSMKFGFVIDFDHMKPATSTNTKP